jgi:DNA-binding MarR family transcriptional regulator
MLDPSTVSRYVAQLVKAGLVERRPDPADGRAVLLVAGEQGQAVGAEAMARRRQLIADLLTTWSDDDARQLVNLLRRLNDEMDSRRDGPGPTAPDLRHHHTAHPAHPA